jgi:predicted type IV restriction endonuclease
MELKEHINEISASLRTGNFSNEAAVSNGIVLRLLHALGWPVMLQALNSAKI